MKVGGLANLLKLAFLVALSTAEKDPRDDQYCFIACQQALSGLTFAGSPSQEETYEGEPCENSLHVQSIFLCVRRYCSEHQVEVGYEYASAGCKASGYSLPSMTIVDSFTMEDMNKIKLLEYGDKPDSFESPVIPSRELYQLGERTQMWWYGGRRSHLWFSKAIFIFWGIVVGIGVIANIVFILIRSIQSTPPRSAALEGPVTHLHSSPMKRVWDDVRAWILLPATLGQSCNEQQWFGTIPPRGESFIIFVYVAINIIFCAVGYTAFDHNLDWDSKATQLWRYFSDRTGYLSYANLVVFFAFGIRNNILIWMTGWQFPTFIRFHRWVARVATLQAVLHSIGYTVFDFQDGGFDVYIADFARRYWWTGTVATISMSFVLVFSIQWFRAKHYELFLVLHIILALMTLVCLFYHTKIFDGEYDGFLWPCVAFWAFDRVCRIARVLYFVVGNGIQNATVEFSQEDQIIRIDVTEIFRRKKLSGGVQVFLYSLFTLWGWQSHPFTLVRWMDSRQGNSSPVVPTSGDGLGEKISSAVVTRPTQSTLEGSSAMYSFLVRPMNGFTARLRATSSKTQGPISKTFLYEGPYGRIPDLRRFSDVLLVIGGSGISIGISFVYNTLEQNADAMLNLVWTCRRSQTYMDSIMDQELRCALETGRLTVNGFVTGSNRHVEGQWCKKLTQGRMNLPAVMDQAVMDTSGSLAVIVCGPPSLADDARVAFVSQLKEGKRDMELFVEGFNW